MPTKHERASEKKFVRTTSGKAKVVYFKGKSKKHHCALCKKILHGVPHSHSVYEMSKLSKTQKKPSVAFGGVLCSSCRRDVLEEAIKVKVQQKEMRDVAFKIKNFVGMALNMVDL